MVHIYVDAIHVGLRGREEVEAFVWHQEKLHTFVMNPDIVSVPVLFGVIIEQFKALFFAMFAIFFPL